MPALSNVSFIGGADGNATVISGTVLDYFMVAPESGLVTNVSFGNITFDSFRRGVADFSSSIGSSLSFDSCTFTNNNTSKAGNGCIRVSGSARFSKCRFTQNYQVFSAMQVPGALFPVTFEECLFDSNEAERNGGACISVWGGYDVSVRNCTFRKNRTWSGYNWSQACFLAYGSQAEITDCVFEENHADSTHMSACVGIVSFAGKMERCRFVRNKATPAIAESVTAGVCLGGDAIVRDCSFVSNTVTAAFGGENSTNALAGAVLHKSGRPALLNCSFIGNRVAGAGSLEGYAGAVVATTGNWGLGLGLANCAFYGTVLDIEGIPQKGAVCAYPAAENDRGTMGMFNCLVSGTEGGENFASSLREANTLLYANVFKGAGDAPLFFAKPVYSPTGNAHMRLPSLSPYAKSGYPVYASGVHVYAYLPELDRQKPYAEISSRTLASADLPEADAIPAPDAFGAPRRPGKIALGPVNPPSPKTTIFLR